jgi:hypothetical protein
MGLHTRSFWAAPLAMLAALGCDPRLPAVAESGAPALPDGGGGGAGGAGAALGLVVVAEPAAPLEAVPRVLRLHASDDGLALDPARMTLLKGALGPRQIEEVVEGKLSATLAKQVVPTLSWSEPFGEALAPEAPLTAGELYTLVVGEASLGVELTVAKTDPVPMLPRVWPPAGGSGTAGLGVWCGAAGAAVPAVDVPVVLEPGALAGRILKGAVGGGAGPSCLRFEADPTGLDGGATGPASPPPTVAAANGNSALVRLDPRPLEVDGPVTPVVPLACATGEVSFGPGCVRLADDRLYGRSGSAPLLWAVTGYGTDTVVATAPGDPFVVTGLPPSSEVALSVATVDAQGRLARSLFLATTRTPEPHVVINEVLAWPLGPSPAEEWVEIVNDGHAKAALGGYVLLVGSEPTPLPAVTLAPGAFALVVDAEYAPAGGPDVPPAAGTVILTVPHLGKEGLSHAGVSLFLIDGDGKTASTFPAKPKPVQGKSLARLVPSAPDGLPSSFAAATPSPGRTNTW